MPKRLKDYAVPDSDPSVIDTAKVQVVYQTIADPLQHNDTRLIEASLLAMVKGYEQMRTFSQPYRSKHEMYAHLILTVDTTGVLVRINAPQMDLVNNLIDIGALVIAALIECRD